MKKVTLPVIIILLIVTLIGCTKKTDEPNFLDEEGIAPYELSESEKYILQSFGIADNSKIISFHAPKEAITMNVSVYRLENDNTWSMIRGSGVSIGSDRKPVDQLTGTFTMQLKEKYAIDFNINLSGRASFKTNEILLDDENEIVVSSIGFLEEFQEIELNEEIPVAIMVYDSGDSMRGYSLQDYFEPSVFEGMDLVQVVTVSFTNKEL